MMEAPINAGEQQQQQQQRHETEAAEAAATTPFSNQETEKAAMLQCGGAEVPATLPSTATAATTITTTSTTTKAMTKLDDAATFAMPATPSKSTVKSSCSSRSSSLKKQRRGVGGGGGHKTSQRLGNELPHEMKTSHSMTSLPADEEQQERRDVIKAKLHMERPYNSLKKNAQSGSVNGSSGGGGGGSSCNNNTCNKMHRYSWGSSGHSHSSSTSLHSSATLGLGSSGKDDLWAAIQTNYNYIMDTNLLDTCKEARCEIEGAATVLEKSNECCFKMLDETQRNEGLCEDPKELRRWLREMEHKLENSPTISELTLFSNAELQRHLAVHSVLYHEIVSHARVVSSCIRAASEREQQSQQPASLTSNCSSSSTSEATKSSTSSGFASDPAPPATSSATNAAAAATSAASQHRKGEGNLERLRDRYHLLYLKAFEVQLCLDNLLRKRSSTTNGLDDDDSDDSFGYEGAATEDDLNDVGSDLDLESESAGTRHSSPSFAVAELQRCHVAATEIVAAAIGAEPHEAQPRDCIAAQKPIVCEDDDDADEENEDADDEVDFVISKRAWHKLPDLKGPPVVTLTDFEADSESSDLEHVQQLRRQRRPAHAYPYALPQEPLQEYSVPANAYIASTADGQQHVAAGPLSMSTFAPNDLHQSQQPQPQPQPLLLQTRHSNKMLANGKPKSIAIITPNSHGSTSHHDGHSKASPVLRKRQPHDTSKFNRSNRKSKNCAIFYFKHLDTDNETSGAGTDGIADGDGDCGAVQASDILKSAEASSDDDEGWLYTATTTNNVNINSTVVFVDGVQSTAVSSTTSAGPAAAAAAPSTSASDDSDKENKEALITTTATAATLTTASSVGVVLVAHATGVVISNGSSNCDSSSRSSSASSSNGIGTETSTASRVTQMQRVDMELQINDSASDGSSSHNNNNNNNNNSNNNNGTRHIISNNCYKQLQSDNNNQQHCSSSSNSSNNNNNSNNNNHCHQQSRLDSKQQMENCQQMGVDLENADATVDNGNFAQLPATSYCSNHTMRPSELICSGNRLPPRSPAKSSKSQASSSNATMLPPMTKGKVSHDSIKQLVLEAEHLVRDAQEAALKTPTKQKQHSMVKISSTVKKRDVSMPGPIKQRVEEWLEHQPSTPQLLSRSHEPLSGAVKSPDDCEASGEASETDSIPQPGGGSDTSEGFTDSIATCMQTSTNSYGNSTERIGGSAEPIGQAVTPLGFGSSNQSLNLKIVKRAQTRRKSERPWSVSCLSQLTTDAAQVTTVASAVGANSPPGLATHSISESALDSLSPGPRPRATSSSGTGSNAARKSDSKGSLRRRRARKKRVSAASAGKKSDSGSDVHGGDLTTLMKSCESMSSQQLEEFTNALLSIQKGTLSPAKQLPSESGGEEPQLMLPKFRVGSFTTALMASESRALAALSNYIHEDEQQLSTEDHHSSISETAWDNYQEKYNSENYSEGFDSDAARRLLEFGDDYRNFIDSQSDCCSSLSAANNLDSFSPPRMDSLQQHEPKVLHINQETIASSVDHVRRQRALELQYERRRKTLEVRRKSCQDMTETTGPQPQSQPQQGAALSASATALTPRNSAPQPASKAGGESVGRKLEFGGHMSHSAQSLLRRTSESDTSTRRRRTVTADERRRSSRNLEKCIKLIPATSSSSADDSDGEQEMRSLLHQSRDRLDDTRALKLRCHLLRPEDYQEIINTCRDNIRCLEAVLHGPPGTVLSAQCAGQTKGESESHSRLTVRVTCSEQRAPECKCAPITRFIARIIDFVLDVSNLFSHFALYRFFLGTLRSLCALVNRPIGRLERLFNNLRGLL